MPEGGKEFIVDAWGQYVAIIKTEATTALKLGYVGVFATAYDCNRIILATATIPVGSNKTFSFALNAACNQSITALV
jgi:hypothetical protein